MESNPVEKEIIKKWMRIAYDENKREHIKHFWIIEDKLIGLNPTTESLKATYDFVKTFDDTYEVHQILNYLLGVIKLEKT